MVKMALTGNQLEMRKKFFQPFCSVNNVLEQEVRIRKFWQKKSRTKSCSKSFGEELNNSYFHCIKAFFAFLNFVFNCIIFSDFVNQA